MKKGYGLWICFVIGTFTGLLAIKISSQFGKDVIKLSTGFATASVSLFAIFNGVGRPLFGTLTDKLGAVKTIVISFTLVILSSIAMYFAKPYDNIMFLVAFSVLWLNLGGWLAIAPTATRNIFGNKNANANYGYIFTAYGVGALLATLLSGKIYDMTGDYKYVFIPTVLFATIGIVVAIKTLKKSKK